MSLLSKLLEASNVTLTELINWPDDVPSDHPIRCLTHIRLWGATEGEPLKLEQARIRKESAKPSDWIEQTYFWVLALGLSNGAGESAFLDDWGAIWAEATPNSANMCPPSELDFVLIGKKLEKLFDSPIGTRMLGPLWEQIMVFNGYLNKAEAQSAKNSKGTEPSKPA